MRDTQAETKRGRFLQRIVAIAASVAMVATGFVAATPAMADTTIQTPGYYSNPISTTSWGAWGQQDFGPIARTSDGKWAYCIQANTQSDHNPNNGTWATVNDANAQKIAWIADKYNNNNDLDQAAITYLVHNTLDKDGGKEYLAVVGQAGLANGNWNDVVNRANQLWAEAENSVPSDVKAESKYTEGKREGEVHVYIKNANGGYVSGIPFRIVFSGPVKFGKTSGTTVANGPTTIPWEATGNGDIKFKVQYNKTVAKRLASSAQDLFSSGDPITMNSPEISFRVVNDFQPTVTTQVSKQLLERGDKAVDTVTSGVSGSDTWITDPKVSVTAKGYFYTVPATEENINLPVNNGERAADYLKRVNAKYGQPVATGEATFTNAGQSKKVTAKNADGSDWVNPEDGNIGTWVWVIDKNTLGDNSQYVKADYVDAFGQKQESSINTTALDEWSEVAEPHAELDSDVRDVIHLSNLPKDFGSFNGNDALGIAGDNTKFTVEVWWAGSGTNGAKAEDEKYKPSTKETPQEDEHHKLVGSYEYDLGQLVKAAGPKFDGHLDIKVAGGDSGTALKDGSKFSIKADKTGYYTFVAKYDGCGRIKAFTSDYDNAFETTFVTKQAPSIKLESNVKPGSVKVGEPFADVATISGTGTANNAVTEGSYVQFDAYEPVDGTANMNVAKILDGQKVMLTVEQIATLNNGQSVDITSQTVTANKSGNVYWNATLHAADGTILAKHEFGIKSETVTVKAGGWITSNAQTFGAVGASIWDDITVGDDTSETSTDGGNIPDGSYAIVCAYWADKQPEQTEDNKFFEKRVDIDTSKLQDADGNRGGSYTFRVETGTQNAPDHAGKVYWTHTLYDSHGAVIDEGKFGEDKERTSIQQFETTASKQTVSVNSDEYADATVEIYDTLKQTAYKNGGQLADTPKGVTYQFEVWQQGAGDVSTDKQVWTGVKRDLPSMQQNGNSDSQKAWQYIKSETLTIGKDWNAGTHYFRVKVLDKGGNVVYYAPQRVPEESFMIVKVTSSTEKMWTTDAQHTVDNLHVEGVLPAGSAYQVEMWKTTDDGTVTGDKPIATSERIALGEDTTGDIKAPYMQVPDEVGGYQWRFKVWSADQLGGAVDADVIPADSTFLNDDWKQGDGYAKQHLIYEGTNVPSEHFEIIRIQTDVSNTANMFSYENGHYVDVTNGADVHDFATIEGKLPAGYKLGFNLYQKDEGDDDSRDRIIATIDPVNLQEAAKQLASSVTNLKTPGSFYWQTFIEKQDGTTFDADNGAQLKAATRIPEESFEAVRITTTTANWTSKGGQASDLALVEGCLPADATANFELHDYETMDKLTETGHKPVKELGYTKCSSSNSKQTIESPKVTVPKAGDHYFVESVNIGGKEFHRGNDRVTTETTRSIAADTLTFVEQSVGTAVSDHTMLENIKYSTGNAQDIRNDLDGKLTASWEVWQQGNGGVDTDKKLATLADGDNAVTLEHEQTEVDSPEYLFEHVGTYYYRVLIKDENGKTIAYGEAREPSETIRIIDSSSQTVEVVAEGDKLTDKVTITGPVAAGTLVSWKVYRQQDGAADKDELIADWDTPQNGAYLITAEDAATAAKDGKIAVTSPKSITDVRGGQDVYFVYSLTSPKRADDGTVMAVAEDGVSHLMTSSTLSTPQQSDTETDTEADTTVDDADSTEDADTTEPSENTDSDTTEPQTTTSSETSNAPVPFYTDKARTPAETAHIIRVTTHTTSTATVGDKIHDTAEIIGHVPDDYCVEFEYWQQDKDSDTAKDKKVTTTECMTVPNGATHVDSPEITAKNAGTYYWRERLIRVKDKHIVHYGKARVAGETVTVKLPNTGTHMTGVIAITLTLLGVGVLAAGVSITRRNKRNVRSAHSA